MLCLVVLLLPTQNIMSQDRDEMDCCKTEQSNHCCDTDPIKENNQHQKECTDCCASSHTCASCYIFLFKNYLQEETTQLNFVQKTPNFTYKTPFFESLEDTIWQPPKIA